MSAEIARWVMVVGNVLGTLYLVHRSGRPMQYGPLAAVLNLMFVLAMYWLGGMFPWDLP